jgi:hypothetical protein
MIASLRGCVVACVDIATSRWYLLMCEPNSIGTEEEISPVASYDNASDA